MNALSNLSEIKFTSLLFETNKLVGRVDYEDWKRIVNYYWIRNKLKFQIETNSIAEYFLSFAKVFITKV